jgi:hypothetical protein
VSRGVGLLLGLWLAPVAPCESLPEFHNVAAPAGLVHPFPNGGSTTKRYILETTGSGTAWIDFDNDGLLDAFLISGEGSTNRLYRNEGKGRFREMTAVGVESSGWGKGVCAADYDNDGFLDLLVTSWGRLALYRNRDGRRFEDVAGKAGLAQHGPRYHTGCAFLDYNKDGHVDLFVANYLQYRAAIAFEPGANPYCFYRGMAVNCGPRGLAFDSNQLFRNNGDGTFTEVSEASGVSRPGQNYALGVLAGDFNHDGWPDVYVACDVTPSLLYINQGDGTFSEEGLLLGVALDENGKALSGMGVAAADFDGNGWLDIFRGNFSDERQTLYRNRGDGDFDEVTISAGLAHNTRFVVWGCGFFDFDNDSHPDLLAVSGHVFPEVDRLNIDIRYKDRAILYRNNGNATFTDISERAGPGIQERHSARGAAFGDIDNDGSLEILINNQNDAPSLLKDVRPVAGNWALLKLTGRHCNRAAIGARVRLTTGHRTQVNEVRSGGSYISQSDVRLHFGLGAATRIDRIEIDWPCGARQVESDFPVNRIVELRELHSPGS